jgi:hypothetical protein
VTVKQIHADGRIALNDGRVLPKNYRQFVRGYAVTSYAAQGKTVDYVLFSDSAVKAATNEQQWYVTISRGRKGVKIFTADKIQLRQNIAHSGHRTLAWTWPVKAHFTSWQNLGARRGLRSQCSTAASQQAGGGNSAERRAKLSGRMKRSGNRRPRKPAESIKPTEAGQARRFKNPKPSGGGLKFRSPNQAKK